MKDRIQLVNELFRVPVEVLTIEPDCTSLCQLYWSEYQAAWDLMNARDIPAAKQAMVDGPWTNRELQGHIAQLSEVAEAIKNSAVANRLGL